MIVFAFLKLGFIVPFYFSFCICTSQSYKNFSHIYSLCTDHHFSPPKLQSALLQTGHRIPVIPFTCTSPSAEHTVQNFPSFAQYIYNSQTSKPNGHNLFPSLFSNAHATMKSPNTVATFLPLCLSPHTHTHTHTHTPSLAEN